MALKLRWGLAGGYNYQNIQMIKPQWYQAYPNDSGLHVRAFIGYYCGFDVLDSTGRTLYVSGEYGSQRWYSNNYAARLGAERMLTRLGLIKDNSWMPN